jgi:acyl-coenzyme A thioesterase PaaI-like protein
MSETMQAPDATKARRDAVAEAGEAMRAAMLALFETETSEDIIQDAADEFRQIAARLGVRRRPPGQLASVDDLARGILMFSPVVGQGNPQAPPLQFVQDERGVSATVRCDRRFEGPPGYVHGGHTALMLDEVLARAMIYAGRWGLTAHFNMRYLRAMPLGIDFVMRSYIVKEKGRQTVVEGGVYSPDMSIEYVTASAVFVSPRPDLHEEYFGSIVDVDGRPTSAKLQISNEDNGSK